MTTNWTLSQDGLSASRTLDNGGMESRMISAIDAIELSIASPYAIPAITLVDYQESAKVALAATDSTFARIQEAITLGLVINTDAVVVEWINYRKALRTEMKATTVNTLPAKPTTYPTGT